MSAQPNREKGSQIQVQISDELFACEQAGHTKRQDDNEATATTAISRFHKACSPGAQVNLSISSGVLRGVKSEKRDLVATVVDYFKAVGLCTTIETHTGTIGGEPAESTYLFTRSPGTDLLGP